MCIIYVNCFPLFDHSESCWEKKKKKTASICEWIWIWSTAPPSGLLLQYLWWGYFDIDDDGSQRGLCQLGGVVDGVCVQSDQLQGARQLKDAFNFTLHLSWNKKIQQNKTSKSSKTNTHTAVLVVSWCFRLVQHHACHFFSFSVPSTWIRLGPFHLCAAKWSSAASSFCCRLPAFCILLTHCWAEFGKREGTWEWDARSIA